MDVASFAFRCFPKRIYIPAALHDQPLQACQTSPRLADVLRRSGVRVLGDLHGRKVGDFAWETNCGFKTLHELDSLARWACGDCGNPAGLSQNGQASAKNAKRRETSRGRKSEEGSVSLWRSFASFADKSVLTVPESVCELRLHELPITTRLANVAQSVGRRTLGDLNGRSVFELLQYKDCGWLTLAEIQQLIERAISGEFDETQIEESTAAAELLTLLEQGMAKLSPRDRHFVLARIGGLTFAEIGRRHSFTRARVQQVVAQALESLRKTYGPRIPRLLEMMKRRCLSIRNSESVREQVGSGLTPALLEQWIGDSSRSFRLSRKAQVRLIAALDKNIPCCVESSPRVRHRADSLRRAFESSQPDFDLASLARVLRLAMAPKILRSSGARRCVNCQ